MALGHYEQGLVCLNGHAISGAVNKYPQHYAPYCDKCGAETIRECQNCHFVIRGKYDSPGVIDTRPYVPPAHCSQCGTPFPWTQRKMDAITELAAELDEFTETDVKSLTDNLPDLVAETPKSAVAAERIKKTLRKATTASGHLLYKFAVDASSETAKKILTPGP